MQSHSKSVQRFSLFHQNAEAKLREWHSPYVPYFLGEGRVVDLGCGPGYFLDLLSEQGTPCVGLDIDPDMVAQAKARGHSAFVASEKEIGEYANGCSCIHISHVIEHLWGEQVVELLQQCANALAEAGILVVRTPNWSHPSVYKGGFWDDYTHKRPYSLSQLNKIFVDVGFNVLAQGYEPYGWTDAYIIGKKTQTPSDSKITTTPRWPASSIQVKNKSLIAKVRKRFRNWLLAD